MAEKYDKNGYNRNDFKRNASNEAAEEHQEQDGEEGTKVNEKAGEYIRDLLGEKIKLNTGKFPVSTRLIEQEVSRVQSTGRIPQRDFKYVDVYREKPAKVVVKVLVPIKEHPKFNFIGKLMGPKGTTMKQLQEETMCKMAVLGRGSMRDRQKEEELRNSLDPKHAHLTDELHVEISALAPPAEAHARIAYALAEVKKYLIPDSAEIRLPPHMHREMMERDMETARQPLLQTPTQGNAAQSGSPPDRAGRWALLETPQDLNVVYRACTVTRRSYSYRNPELRSLTTTDAHPHHAPPRVPRHPAAPRMPPQGMRPMPSKTKVLSILDRARSAMETSYPYEDPYAAPEPPVRQVPRGLPRAPEPDYYSYERGQERFYEDDSSYYKEESRDYKASARDVGSRRPGPAPSHARHYSRASPYQRAPKPTTAQKKRSQ